MEGPRSPQHCSMPSLELGAPRLAYGFALAASTSVDSPRREFFKFVLVRWRWRQGELSQLPKKEVVTIAHFAPPRCDGAMVVALVFGNGASFGGVRGIAVR
jgi:hypothetical protein